MTGVLANKRVQRPIAGFKLYVCGMSMFHTEHSYRIVIYIGSNRV